MINMNKVNMLKGSLDAYWERQKVISNNIANADTPNYKRKVYVFEEKLKEKLNSNSLEGYNTNQKHIDIGKKSSLDINDIKGNVKVLGNTRSRLDENNVDVDVEMAHLSKNVINYNTTAQQTLLYMNRLKSVIRGGK
ncbi:MAG: flagellar basal body rod protein FlgB [Peptostreptococcaceae bacterium]|nr:flagellar basal body rod protein FlgB [Peptostreptococcaceae bacterium]